MKQLLFVLMIALSATTYGQRVYNAPQVFTNTLDLQGAVSVTAPFTLSYSLIMSKETASTHNYTFTGMPICAITTTRLDTINLVTASYTAGQIFTFYTTTSANDSTKLISTSGTINGAASPYWMTGTYGAKSTTLYFDGTNYWKL